MAVRGQVRGRVTKTQKVENSARGIAREEFRGALRVLHFDTFTWDPVGRTDRETDRQTDRQTDGRF